MDGQVIIGNWNDNIICEKWNLFIKYKYYMSIKWRINILLIFIIYILFNSIKIYIILYLFDII